MRKKRLNPPRRGELITASFLNDVAEQQQLASVRKQEPNLTIATVQVLEEFTQVGGVTEGTCAVLDLYIDGNQVNYSANSREVQVIDVTNSLYPVGEILNVWFNSSVGKYQALSSFVNTDTSVFQCGCKTFLPPQFLTVDDQFSNVYYFIGHIPGPWPLGASKRIRLEHVSGLEWQSVSIPFFDTEIDTAMGHLEMTVDTKTIFYGEDVLVAYVTFVIDSGVDPYEFPLEYYMRTIEPFNGALNSNKLVFVPPPDPNSYKLMYTCGACLAASRDLLPCEECLFATRAIVDVLSVPSECIGYFTVTPKTYELFSEVNSFFDGLPGWPIADVVCAFESEETFVEQDFHYKIVLLRMESTSYYLDDGLWKLAFLGWDTDSTDPVLITKSIVSLDTKTCRIIDDTSGYITPDGCQQPVIVRKIDSEVL